MQPAVCRSGSLNSARARGTLLPAASTPVQPTALPTLPVSAPLEIVPVPAAEIQINGIPYLSYQMPGDPFRFVCRQPCTADPAVIHGQYAGFRRARDLLLQVTGIDTLPELQPVDIHLTNDEQCGTLADAGALSFAWYRHPGNAYVCTFLFEYRGQNGESYTPELASEMYNQVILLHEYLHTIFYGRLPDTLAAMHDFVTPVALYVTGTDSGPEAFCSYNPITPPGDYGGYLIWELCRRNGFTLETFRSSLIELDALYQAGGGSQQQGLSRLTPSISQYREILNRLLGSDTRQAFADACWPALPVRR